MNLVLILLQSNEPPTAYAHGEESQDTTNDDTGKPSNPAASSQSNEHAPARVDDKHNGKSQVATPRYRTETTSKDGKEPKHFNGEECEREYVGRRFKSRS